MLLSSTIWKLLIVLLLLLVTVNALSCTYVETLLKKFLYELLKNSYRVTDCHGRQACFTVIRLPKINKEKKKASQTLRNNVQLKDREKINYYYYYYYNTSVISAL